jgi:hypothetical protein
VVEIQDRDKVAIHPDVATAVDAILRGEPAATEVRWVDENDEIQSAKQIPANTIQQSHEEKPKTRQQGKQLKLYLFGVNRGRLEQAAAEMQVNLHFTDNIKEANLLVTTKQYFRRRPPKLREAEAANIPLYVLKSNTPPQIGN